MDGASAGGAEPLPASPQEEAVRVGAETSGVPNGVPFTLRQLQIFAAVAEAGTISRAAERLIISQTAVSLSVSQLEKALGVKLLTRRRAHGVSLTTTGQSVLGLARSVLGQAGSLYEEISGTGEITGPVSIGCFPSLGPTVLPSLVQGFLSQHPKASVNFREDMQENLEQELLSGALDMVISYDLGLPATLRQLELSSRRPGILVAEDHWAARTQDPVDLTSIAAEPFILLDSPLSTNHVLAICRTAGMSPHIAYRSQNFETVRSLVGRGFGWTILLQRPKVDLTHEGLRVVMKEFAAPVDPVAVVMAWPRNRPLSRAARAFIQFARSTGSDSLA